MLYPNRIIKIEKDRVKKGPLLEFWRHNALQWSSSQTPTKPTLILPQQQRHQRKPINQIAKLASMKTPQYIDTRQYFMPTETPKNAEAPVKRNRCNGFPMEQWPRNRHCFHQKFQLHRVADYFKATINFLMASNWNP